MKNVGSPFLIMLTDRRRAPEGATIGKIKNVIDYGHLVEKEYNDDIFYVFIVEEV